MTVELVFVVFKPDGKLGGVYSSRQEAQQAITIAQIEANILEVMMDRPIYEEDR